MVEVLRRILLAHFRLPRYLRAWLVVPATIILVVVSGLSFTLPPGPLCDEGMILFMEGGCDWGDSNVFFFSKLSLLVALNVVFVLAWRRQVVDILAFVPHFGVLAITAVANLSGGHCDTYYSHPNGSLGQMAIEGVAFALVGCSILPLAPKFGGRWLIPIVTIWNAMYVGIFYLALEATPHWTWQHTFVIVAGLSFFAGLAVVMDRKLASRPVV